ncbi:MAG TPA: leucyl/phenylalanyl-tRNA--protein transferase, partial [Magnetospirillaceae bacterium]|nr:leucyl/phenylalanyl-tRNA--protein transferase [Magnetospirillaceae bacterium]
SPGRAPRRGRLGMNPGAGETFPFPFLPEDQRIAFPDPRTASRRGVVCVGANLSPGVILSAYAQGIFPWFSGGGPILWWSPDPRFVIFPREVRASESMLKVLRRGEFSLTLDTDFRSVIEGCASVPRPGQNGTWITRAMKEAYMRLHELGVAHSVEARRDGELAGGLYGVSLGRLFCGESMFFKAPNASKAALIALAWRLADEGFKVIDSQVGTSHVASMGGRNIPRARYLDLVEECVNLPSIRGSWDSLFPGFPDSTSWRTFVHRS